MRGTPPPTQYSAQVGRRSLLLALGSAGWFLGSPLFIRTELVEAGPMASAAGAGSEDTATDMAAGLLSGEFQGADEFHFGEGRAAVVEQPDGTLVLRFEKFSVLNGPTSMSTSRPARTATRTGAIDLGSRPRMAASITSC